MTLLIINDEMVIADTMKAEMEWEAYGIDHVCTAYDACGAREIISSGGIDIMLCDIEMPGENGLSLLRWVREQDMDIECVFLTCHAKFAYAQEAIGLQCQDYILMPAKYEDIGETIHGVVNRIKHRKEERRYIEYGKYSIREKGEKRTESEEAVRINPAQVVEEVTEYIIRSITEPELNVEHIAEHFHFHPVYVNRIFRAAKNISISQYIISERMKMAVILLEEGTYSANEVAEAVGYSHYTNFYNMFKKTYQISPNDYVKKYIRDGRRL